MLVINCTAWYLLTLYRPPEATDKLTEYNVQNEDSLPSELVGLTTRTFLADKMTLVHMSSRPFSGKCPLTLQLV
jgi:hypothetical protein